MTIVRALQERVKLEPELMYKVSCNLLTRYGREPTAYSFSYSPPTTFPLIFSNPPQTSIPGCTFSAYSAGGSFNQTVLLCHLKYGFTPSTSANAAD